MKSLNASVLCQAARQTLSAQANQHNHGVHWGDLDSENFAVSLWRHMIDAEVVGHCYVGDSGSAINQTIKMKVVQSQSLPNQE